MAEEEEGSGGSANYRLSPSELESLHQKYGRPGEIAPGQPATKKRNRLHNMLGKQNRKNNVTLSNEESEAEPDIKT